MAIIRAFTVFSITNIFHVDLIAIKKFLSDATFTRFPYATTEDALHIIGTFLKRVSSM